VGTYVSRRLGLGLGATVVVLLCLAAALIVAVKTEWAPVLDLDDGVRTHLDRYGVEHSGWVSTWNVITTLLQPNVWRVIATILVALLIWYGQRESALTLAGVLVLAAVASVGIKAAVARPRPVPYVGGPHATGASFPSGHALTAAAAVIALIAAGRRLGLLENAGRRWAAWATGVVIVAVVSFSRLALGVHYLSDVVGGLLIGAACALTVPWALDRFTHRLR
jgi:membrane-associated phospholipid phosphatase